MCIRDSAYNYLMENFPDGCPYPVLKISQYPLPTALVKRLAAECESLLVIEEGQPMVEEMIRGILGTPIPIKGRLSGELPRTGELNPDCVREALGLEAHARHDASELVVPRPPALCMGCGHRDMYKALTEVVREYPDSKVFSDIGCYTLGNAMPLDMVDTGFYVPESKRNRLVTAYKRTENGLVPWTSTHLAVGVYDREPAFESGGAGLVSTLEDYSHFTDMLLAGGTYEGRRILSPATVACMTQPQLKDAVRRDMWDSLDGYSYGHLMRICAEPGRIAGLACAGEYGWDGWLGTYFANFPGQQMTILSMQNTVDSGTTRVVRRMRNAVLAALSREN